MTAPTPLPRVWFTDHTHAGPRHTGTVQPHPTRVPGLEYRQRVVAVCGAWALHPLTTTYPSADQPDPAPGPRCPDCEALAGQAPPGEAHVLSARTVHVSTCGVYLCGLDPQALVSAVTVGMARPVARTLYEARQWCLCPVCWADGPAPDVDEMGTPSLLDLLEEVLAA